MGQNMEIVDSGIIVETYSFSVMNARLNLGITFGFVNGRRMVKVVIDQKFVALHQRYQLHDSPSTFEVYHLLWTRVFEGIGRSN